MKSFSSKIAVFSILASSLWAQSSALDQNSTMNINFPDNSPLAVVSASWGDSAASSRGSAMLLDLHTSLSLRNSSPKRIRSVTLLVRAQDVTPGGKASVSAATLNVGPGEVFPLRIDLSLLRPSPVNGGPVVEIDLDGVLFDDMSFFGPNVLNCRRSMMVWEAEARRDRRYFKNVLETAGREGLRSQMVASLSRQAERTSMDARVSQSGRATSVITDHQVKFAFLEMPDAPVELSGGVVGVHNDEVRKPRMLLQNNSDRPLRGMEIGWMVKDSRGKQYVVGSIPIEIQLGPREKRTVVQDAIFKFSQPGGQAIAVDGLTGFVSSVEFADGKMWVPERNSKLPSFSPEEQRLAELYRKRGIDVVIDELRKF